MNYWLERIELEEVAEKLKSYIQVNVKGRLFIDVKTDINKFMMAFYMKNPSYRKFEPRFNVKVTVAPVVNDTRHTVMKVKVEII